MLANTASGAAVGFVVGGVAALIMRRFPNLVRPKPGG
jgi:hypothetical protein